MDKTTVQLPSGLAGNENLLLLSWARDQHEQVESWTAVAQALQHLHADARVYTVLVSPRENPLFRWWDDTSLRASQTDPDLLPWTLALYTDEGALRRALALPNTRQVVALLVARGGRVLWLAEGAPTPKSRASLLAAAGGYRGP